jgi:ABC-type methionine transport system ATPase subunit
MLYAPKRISGDEMKRRALAALAIVGLADRADHLPSQLSGGQQQRVAIARALVNEPRLLLADEPTGNLDSKTSVEVMGVFQRLNEQGITLVMVTHELEVANYCKRILVVRDGLVVRDEPVARRSIATEELVKAADDPSLNVSPTVNALASARRMLGDSGPLAGAMEAMVGAGSGARTTTVTAVEFPAAPWLSVPRAMSV